MQKQFLLSITGPTGSGKSTTARLLSEQLAMCVNIDVDQVKHFIVSGFMYEEPSGINQWTLLGRNIGMLAANFRDEGYTVIVNGYLREPAWIELAKYVNFTHKFLLLPKLEKVQKRNISRDFESQMDDNAVLQHHAFFSNHNFYADFTKIDSSDQTADETAEIIKSALK